jgi:hypothetical protein
MNKKYIVDTSNLPNWKEWETLGNDYYNHGQNKEAEECWRIAHQIRAFGINQQIGVENDDQ